MLPTEGVRKGVRKGVCAQFYESECLLVTCLSSLFILVFSESTISKNNHPAQRRELEDGKSDGLLG